MTNKAPKARIIDLADEREARRASEEAGARAAATVLGEVGARVYQSHGAEVALAVLCRVAERLESSPFSEEGDVVLEGETFEQACERGLQYMRKVAHEAEQQFLQSLHSN